MKPTDLTLNNASVVIAGGVCLLIVLSRVFSPFSGILPVRGFWLSTLLLFPLLCLWCGMLVRYRIGRPKTWLQVLVGLLAVLLFYCSRHSVNGPGINGQCILFLFQFLLGLLLPWDHIRENGDHTGVKSALICVITALAYAALFLVWQRLGGVMRPECEDMEQLLLVVVTNILPLASIPPLVMAVEFSFSKAGQWLGSRKWFFWLSVPAALFCFINALAALPYGFWFDFSYHTGRWIMLFVQPVTVYLLVVLWRVIVKLIKGVRQDFPTWKDVLKI